MVGLVCFNLVYEYVICAIETNLLDKPQSMMNIESSKLTMRESYSLSRSISQDRYMKRETFSYNMFGTSSYIGCSFY